MRLADRVQVLRRIALPLLRDDLVVALHEHVFGPVAAAGGVVPHHRLVDDDGLLGTGDDLVDPRLPSQHFAGVDHGAHDGVVGRAPADVSGQGGLHLIGRRIGIAVEQRLRGDLPAGGAVPAVRGHVAVADLLHWMEVLLVTQTFDGEDLLADGLRRQRVARVERHAVHQHAAGAATGAVAASVGACQSELDRDDFPQRGSRLVVSAVRLAVDGEGAGLLRHRRRNREW